MSFRAVSWAFDRVRGLSATEKLVLLALAEFANDDDETWRSRESLAERAECSLSSVERSVRTLRTHGLLEVTGRYAWCGREDAACASRGAHKHRAGTTYHLRLDVAVDVKKTASDSLVASTSVNLTGVAESAESRGKSHTRQFDGYGSTSVTQGVPYPSPVTGVLSKNLQLEPPTRPDPLVTTGSVGSVEVVSDRGVAAPGGAMPHGTTADVDLAAECLPVHLRGLDAAGLATVADLLRERLAAGWTSQGIYALMDQPSPQRTSRLSGVVAYRLRENVRPELAPARLASRSRAVALEPVVEPVEQAWDDLVWSPRFLAALGDTKKYLSAGKTAAASIEVQGLTRDAFRAAWLALDDSMPALDRGRAALASLVAA